MRSEVHAPPPRAHLALPLRRPLLHALVSSGVAHAWGVELDRIKCDKAAAFGRHVVAILASRGMLPEGTAVPEVRCSSIEQVGFVYACVRVGNWGVGFG